MSKIGRNDPCHCGSGQKYKKCHLAADDAAKSAELTEAAAAKAKEAEEAEKAEGEKAEGEKATTVDRAATKSKDAAGTRPRTPAPTQAPAFRRKAV